MARQLFSKTTAILILTLLLVSLSSQQQPLLAHTHLSATALSIPSAGRSLSASWQTETVDNSDSAFAVTAA